MKKTLTIVAIAASAMLMLAGCSGGADTTATPKAVPTFAAGSTMEKLAKAGKITIGTKFDQPLFGLKGPDGPVGFDVEMGKMIAASLGIKAENIQWKETISANREPFIQSGEVDLVIATYTINDLRKKAVSFAGPYYSAGQSILVKADNKKIKSEKDLVGKPVCSVTGSTPAARLAEIGAKPLLTDIYSNCLEPLRSGAAVAVSTDNVILAGLAAQNEGEFKVVGKPFTEEPYGIGLKLDDKGFRSYVNSVLTKSYKDGSYKKAWEDTAGKMLPYVAPPAVDNY
ncbi:glutamate ABC transporter substrate-binding protein [Lacisediminihabitans profunda]|uniref:Glutamate ABC transporter substrate-binding protein n=1 Tax=Lacisediminihabitans profunda TaxID=2594790 RepID=A0A5C8USM5_9MICO|nr:glutamate ABC transporter substrate-binding protein [Lacisediminihabitans profunda]TXN31555.1 glutamate ABC transporter substrate-binding protein [Lacisediminihabitans profunda]